MKRIDKIELGLISSSTPYAIKDGWGLYRAFFDHLKYWKDEVQECCTLNFKVQNGMNSYYGISFSVETGELFSFNFIELYELENDKDFEKLQLAKKLIR